jgi:glycosyltransferase involved in cell wall biosynthesis
MTADVTAVIACFNYGAYVGEAVQSVLRQPGPRPHVIVVDDGSTDPATHAALDALPAEVEVVRQPNAGVCTARNTGIARARTPFVLCLDADDRLAPDVLPALRAPLEADVRLGFAYGWHRFFGAWSGELRFPAYDPLGLLDRHQIGLTALTRIEVFRDTGGFDPVFTRFEDWELWLNALAHGWRGVRVPVVVLEYRRHGASKLVADRRGYRAMRRQAVRKHRGLYARRRELAAESNLGLPGRLVHRLYWGPRPLPARVEAALHRAWFSPSRPRHG